jgi:hypothetical protein
LNVPALQRANDLESLTVLLRQGIPGTEMPALALQVVADEPLRGLAAYVEGLRENSRVTPSSPTGSGAELVRTSANTSIAIASAAAAVFRVSTLPTSNVNATRDRFDAHWSNRKRISSIALEAIAGRFRFPTIIF